MRWNTIVSVWESSCAWDIPWNNTDELSIQSQWAARVSLANSLSFSCECANFVVKDESSISSCVSSTAISICQCCLCETLKLIWWCTSTLGSSTPSWNNGCLSTSDCIAVQWNSTSIGCECDCSCCFNDWDVIGDCVCLILWRGNSGN